MLELIFGLFFGFIEILDFILTVIDAVSWIKSRSNRKEIKNARINKLSIPKRNLWNRIFLVLTPIVIILSLLIIWKYFVL